MICCDNDKCGACEWLCMHAMCMIDNGDTFWCLNLASVLTTGAVDAVAAICVAMAYVDV